eukprot:CAMPEP_0113716192 /NCGR_PEP_ID=MMETSP0038_2-20120614/33750_1 /TAXON_ID=2898 /ORGANISM="Cryptomonas paramecium" /LENGTH=320 /DNA_ID=CAMNT_0000643681 /DNA_START=357 /DNA_END=1316 /DNA_ORIENTATION=- /assembly_acc=CAM_ASM_000170
MITVTSEWNIDFASENLEGTKESYAEGESSYTKYDSSELYYTYEPDVLDNLPPATSALYGSDNETTIQESSTKFSLPYEQDEHDGGDEEEGSDGEHDWSESTHPSSPSHESVDDSFESQVSTPQASPRREEEPRRMTSRPRKMKIEKIEKIEKPERSTKKKELRVQELRAKTSRSQRFASAHAAREESHAQQPARSALLAAAMAQTTRTRHISPLPDEADDPQGLFSRDPTTLSAEELKQLKKRKRLIKNRESAQLSRQRKRIRLETLQAEVLNLEGENKGLHARVDQLLEENAALKRKLAAFAAACPAAAAEQAAAEAS